MNYIRTYVLPTVLNTVHAYLLILCIAYNTYAY